MRKTRPFLTLALALALSAGCKTVPENPPADIVFRNGTVWTGVSDEGLQAAVAVVGDRIAAVGSDEETARYVGAKTEVIDLDGRFLMPGFIDNHTHFVDGGFKLLGIDLRPSLDHQDFARRIREYAPTVPQGSWILGGDWDHEAWPSRAIPHKDLIDADTPDTPVFVNRFDGHMALANSRALQLAGITRRTVDPAGGTIVRDESGRPTGMLKDAAMNLVSRVIPPPSMEQRLTAARTALEEARRLGVTTVNAMASFEELTVFQKLLGSGELTSRIYAITPLPQWKRLADVGIMASFGNEFLQIGALKGFMDGSLGSTTAWFYDPYVDEPETSGLPSGMWFPEGNMKKMILEADAAGFHLIIHAIGDRANDELLRIFAEVEEQNGRRDRRFRIEHAQHLSPQSLESFMELGVVASMQPYHAIDDGRWAENRIGPERIKTTYAFRSLLDSNAVVTFGSDWTVAPLSPLLGIYGAVTRQTLDGANPDGWVPEQKISVEDALFCYTINNAYAIFREDDLGSVEPGKLADLVVLDGNPFEVDPAEIGKIQVVRTIVGGKTVFEQD